MPEISIKTMLEAGVHFGHQTHRWNPKMKSFIFGPRGGIYIIDLAQTARQAKVAVEFLRSTVASGGKILFVATKKQAKNIVKEAADATGMPYVIERWLGGSLTNFQTIRRGCDRLDEIERWKTDGTYEALSKREISRLERKRRKLEQTLGGLRKMKSLPQALFVIDPGLEKNAVAEANRLQIPVVAVVDTNCDPDPIDYVIPGNDDAIKSVSYFVSLISNACTEGAALFEKTLRSHGAPAHDSAPTQPGDVSSSGNAPRTSSGHSPAAYPVVEHIAKKHIRNIPAEIDYRESEDEDEDAARPAGAAETAPTTEELGTPKDANKE